MILMPNEEKIVTSNQDKIVLTDRRIYMQEKQWGQAYTISIFLEDISSIETKYKSNIFWIILAVLALSAGLYMEARQGQNNHGLLVGLLVCGIFLTLWWFSRRHIISISPDGGSKMNFQVEGMRDEKVEGFVLSASEAKQNRVNELTIGSKN